MPWIDYKCKTCGYEYTEFKFLVEEKALGMRVYSISEFSELLSVCPECFKLYEEKKNKLIGDNNIELPAQSTEIKKPRRKKGDASDDIDRTDGA